MDSHTPKNSSLTMEQKLKARDFSSNDLLALLRHYIPHPVVGKSSYPQGVK